MKIFSPSEGAMPARLKILLMLKGITEEHYPLLKEDASFSIPRDREDQFFLRSSEGILWGKIYTESFDADKAVLLQLEKRILSEGEKARIRLRIFAPQFGFCVDRAQDYPEAEFYRYSLIQSGDEQAMLVERISFVKETPTITDSQERPELVRNTGKASARPQLTRQELAELIDLSLDLKAV